MADDKTKTGRADRNLISLNEDYEVRDWSKKFGVTPEELKKAVQTVMRGKTYVSSETPQEFVAMTDRSAREKELLERLTPRQREILELIAEGQATKKIARTLDISTKTVESHRAQLTERLNIHEVAGLVRFAIRTGLVKME